MTPETIDVQGERSECQRCGSDGARVDRPAAKNPRRRRRGGLSIQSKLLIMLLAVSLISSVIVGVIGYINGRESLRAAAIDQLTTIRELRVGELESSMKTIQDGVALDSRNLSAQIASNEINAGWDELQTRQLSPEQEAELEAYYAGTFNPELEVRTGDSYSSTAFIPASNAGRWVQYHLTSKFTDSIRRSQ